MPTILKQKLKEHPDFVEYTNFYVPIMVKSSGFGLNVPTWSCDSSNLSINCMLREYMFHIVYHLSEVDSEHQGYAWSFYSKVYHNKL